MAFKRKILLAAGKAATGILLSELHVDFFVEKSITANANTATFTIYNVGKTEKLFLLAGSNIIFQAGHEDEGNMGIIFSGKITKSSTVKQEQDKITTLVCTDLGSNIIPYLKTTLSLSFIANTPITAIISSLTSLMGGLPISGLQNISTITLKNNWTYTGTISGALRMLQKNLEAFNFSFFFDNGEFVIYNKLAPSSFNIVNVSTGGGLVGSVEDITDDEKNDKKKRIQFTTLLNPQIKLLSAISVLSNTVKGIFFAEKLVFSGNNYGGDFYTQVEAAL